MKTLQSKQKPDLMVLITGLSLALSSIAALISIIKEMGMFTTIIALFAVVISIVFYSLHKKNQEKEKEKEKLIPKQSAAVIKLMQITPLIEVCDTAIYIKFPIVNGLMYPIEVRPIQWSFEFVNCNQLTEMLDSLNSVPPSRTLTGEIAHIPVGGVKVIEFKIPLHFSYSRYKIRTLDLVANIQFNGEKQTLANNFPKEIEFNKSA